jgi:hypothetical protein
MNFQKISPIQTTTTIDSTVDFFVVSDHMPGSSVNWAADLPLDQIRVKYFGQNTIVDMFNNQGLNPDDYFFIFDHYLNLKDFEGYFYPNFLLTTAVDYQKFSPNHVIDFTQKKYSVNCVMNKPRQARYIASCWLYNNKIDGLLHTQSWSQNSSVSINQLDELLQLGKLIDWTHKFGPAVKMLDQHWIDYNGNLSTDYGRNDENFFNGGINTIFDTTAISIVLEPVFWENGSIATEKYMHAIYGGTIPVVSGYQIYDSLNKLGFDTFSDIIDTSSQYELDPVLRIWNMLEKNKNLFSQWQDLILDPLVQNRIVNNLNLLQNPEKIFKNSIRLNSKRSLDKIVSLNESLKSYGFQYFDMLPIPE